MYNKLSILPTESLYPACLPSDDIEKISSIFDLDELLTEENLKLLDTVPLRTIASGRGVAGSCFGACSDESNEGGKE